jgi:pimeloyl-ACP methyl ester carboxylesterase
MRLHSELRHDLRETPIAVGDITLNVLTCGDPGKPLMMFLHGFPEYSGMWTEVMPRFAEDYFCVAPDQRGYNLSSRPKGKEHYKTSKMAGDAVALAEKLSPGAPIVLVGHDWGASVAYAMAMWKPEMISDLVIINGLHPATFQHALLTDPEQIRASQYFHYLRAPTTDEELAANGCLKLFDLFAYFSDVSWMTTRHRRDYLTAWSQPGAVTAMLDWYRSSPIHVPLPGEDVSRRENPFADTEKMRVKSRHLLIWGEGDPSLRTSCHRGLGDYCDDLTKVIVPDADHWIVGAKPDLIVNEITHFLASRGGAEV